ncbi:platelet endothelial cell adhesion molecule isoform X1 [Pelobates fuscus]|uniref:platelet endothelial cell adhesion molecule isoform X1 n=1 Tax=Pelobates fuscus TaxID=191477 RepID=UPI002FE4A742
MYLVVVFFFCTRLINAQNDVFTINDVKLESSPHSPVANGATLNLDCSVDITKNGEFDLLHTFMFYKNDVLVYNITSGRANTTFTINPARVSSSGIYKCQVDVEGKSRSKELEIRVTGVSPPKIHIRKTEVKEGEDVSVTCEAPEEDPPLFFTFYKFQDSILVSQKSRSATNQKSLQVNFPIEKGDKILRFNCDVKVGYVSDEAKSALSEGKFVTVTEPFSTPKIEVSPSNNFTEGINMLIKCSVQKPPPSSSYNETVEITIQKDKEILKSSTTESVIFSQLATVKEMGDYTCKAETKKTWKSSSVFITIAELFARPRLSVHGKDNLNEGDRLSLMCEVPGLSSNVSKNQNFYLLNKNFRQKMVLGKHSTTVKEKDSGSYLCEVTISNITKRSDPVNIRVHAAVSKPILTQSQNNNRMVVAGETLILNCICSSGTLPITYSLYRGGQFVGRVNKTDKAPAVFMVNVTKSDDLGEYRCHAANRNTLSNQFSDSINITVITPVDKVHFLTIPEGTVEEGTELGLSCTVENGTFPIEFKFYFKKGKEEILINVTKTNAHHAKYIISSFNKEEDGGYFCRASNQAKHSVSTEPIALKAVLAKWKKGVLSAFIIFIILAVIVISLYFYLDRKKKGQRITLDKARTSKTSDVNHDKATLELKNEDSYYGSMQNEDENHVLKHSEENKGNDHENNEVEYTEVEVDAASPLRDPVTKATDTVYSEIRRSNHDASLNNAHTTEDSPNSI